MYENKKVALYIVITGNYESYIRDSNPLKLMPCLDAAFVVTDSIHMKNEAENKGWSSILIAKPEHSKKCQRKLKILQNFHEDLKVLNEYDVIIYHDGDNSLSNYSKLINGISQLNNVEMVCYKHPKRNTSKEELQVVLNRNLISKEAYQKVRETYMKNNYPDNLGLSDTRVLIRKSDISLKSFCEEWINEMEKTGSYRDQTFFEYAMWKSGILFKRFPNKNFPFVIKGKHHDPFLMRSNTK